MSVIELQKIYKVVPVKAFNLRAAAEVLRAPERVYYGIRWEEGRGRRYGWCYVGRPRFVWNRSDRQYPLPAGAVFTVYLDEQMDVFEWRYEDADPSDPGVPLGPEARFDRLVWRRP